MLHPNSDRCVGITAHLLNRALDSDLIVHEMRFNKNKLLLFDWRVLTEGRAGNLGYLECMKWLPKKTANFMHEFHWRHFPSLPENDFPRLPDDRSRITNLHEKLPMSIIQQLLDKLVLQQKGSLYGHYHFCKCMHLEHKLYQGKQHVRSQPFPKHCFNGYILVSDIWLLMLL